MSSETSAVAEPGADAVGVVGLGAMGGPIASHLLQTGLTVVCADSDPARLAAYLRAGADRAGTLAALARRTDVVLVVVPTDDDVLAVCTGPDGLLAGCGQNTALVLCSSLRPDTCAAVAAAAAPGVDVLDAALTGGVRAAEAGTINLLVGGDRHALTRITPALRPWTATIHHLGPLGAGQVGKTVNNLLHWAQISAIVEALELARRYGVPVSQMRAALYDGPTDSRTLHTLEAMRFTWHAKDLANARVMAEQVGMTLPMAAVAEQVMKAVTVEKVADLLGAAPSRGRQVTKA